MNSVAIQPLSYAWLNPEHDPTLQTMMGLHL